MLVKGTPIATVLVVDDEIMVRRLAVLALEPAGFRVLTAGDVLEAEAALRDHGPVDAVVMDVLLEGTNGFEVMEQLAQVRHDLPVVYMSGYPGQMLYERLAIAAPFLPKPFTPDELVEVVMELIGMIGTRRRLVDARKQPIA